MMDKMMMDKKEMVREKIKKMMHEGKKKDQSVAIALSMAKKRK